MSRLRERLKNLPPEKRAILLKRLQDASDSSPSDDRIPRCDTPGPHPLSPSQRRLWLIEQIEPGGYGYNVLTAVEFRGDLQPEVLRRALEGAVDRHDALRTVFRASDDGPVQIVKDEVPVALPRVDLRGVDAAARQQERERLVVREARRPFDLGEGPLLRALLLRLTDDRWILFMTLHHIVGDGWSQGLLVRDVHTLYESLLTGTEADLPTPERRYVDYAVWQNERLDSDEMEDGLAYWTEHLDGAPPELDLPLDHARPPSQTFRGALHPVSIPARQREALQAIARENGATLYMTLLAAFYVLLYRLTGQSDLVVGSPIANRSRSEFEEIVGFFANTLALRADFAPTDSFTDVLSTVRRITTNGFAHQEVPFESVVEAVDPARNPSTSPIFQVMFQLNNTPFQEMELPGVSLEPIHVDAGISSFDLTLVLKQRQDRLDGVFEYNVDLFEASTIRRFARAFRTLLGGIVDDTDRAVSRLPVLDAEARAHVNTLERGPEASVPDERVHERVRRWADRRPDASALVDGDNTLTYAGLMARVDRAAGCLQARGVGRGDRVGLVADGSADLVTAMLAVMQIGAAYVPLDPTYPDDRIHQIATDANLTARYDASDLASLCAPGAPAPSPVDVPASAPAYLIYTSGSTGRPKGVVVGHDSLAHYTAAAADFYTLSHQDRVLQFASPSFDVSVEEIFTALSVGATLITVPSIRQQTPAALLDTLNHRRITTASLPTAYWHLLVAEMSDATLPSALQTLIIGGEEARPDRIAAWHERIGTAVRLINSYGPTEGTVAVTAREIDTPDAVDIGRPFAGTRVHVLDDAGQPVPVGVDGELYLGGPQVAQGYHERPRRTATAFVPDPYGAPGARLYRTGDRVRWSDAGTLEFRGRVDRQVKIRGFRVEPASIESALGALDRVADSAVTVHTSPDGSDRLVGHVVWAPGAASSPSGDGAPDEAGREANREANREVASLRDALADTLPGYMVPDLVTVHDTMPTTPNGKIDRDALRQMEAATHTSGNVAYVPPETPLEEALAALWEDVLDVDRVGRTDDFFARGGHSLLAMKLATKVRDVFGVDLTLRSLFESPTVAGLATALEAQDAPDRLHDVASVFLRVLHMDDEEASALHGELSAS